MFAEKNVGEKVELRTVVVERGRDTTVGCIRHPLNTMKQLVNAADALEAPCRKCTGLFGQTRVGWAAKKRAASWAK